MDAKIIGNKIKSRRTELNMTQKELAAKINVSNQLISKWETGLKDGYCYSHDMILTGKVGNKNYIAIKSGEENYDYRFYIY